MNNYIYPIDLGDLNLLQNHVKTQAIESLEAGLVVYFPTLSFKLNPDEHCLLSESILDPHHKNIGYDYQHKRLGVANAKASPATLTAMQEMMHRFAGYAKHALDSTLPAYSQSIRWGRTSYRPAEIKGRKTSKRKDDTRLHVDSFSASPVYGQRILRVFCNINPSGLPRTWHLGEPFSKVLATFAPRIPPYSKLRAKLLQLTKTTKALRSPYDHYMLHLHDSMKKDDHYQQKAIQHRFDFPSNTTWMVFTDHVSHAALSGQFLLEQTFYLPVHAMNNAQLSPLRQWEKEKSYALL